MSLYIVDIHGELEGDYEIIRKYEEPTTKNDLGVDCISKKNALRVANNEYLRGFHNALCKALNETYSIHCDEGHFRVIQKETLVGLGMSMESALGPDAESFMNTLPLVTPQEPCDKCEVGNPCLYCKHEFEPQESEDKE